MNSFELKIWNDEAGKVTFYSVLRDGATKTEADKFFEKHIEIDRQSTNDLYSFIVDVIGEQGALDDFFNRDEEEVFGLPFQGKIKVGEVTMSYPNFPLRIFAIRIINNPDIAGNDIVILFNGGKKTAWKIRDSLGLNTPFQEAKRYAKRIMEAYGDGTIVLDRERRILRMFDESEEIVL